MVGELLLSQVLTLYMTPVIYLYLDRFQQWLVLKRRTALPRLAEKMAALAAD
jgi:multidrug efflux pump